MGEDDLCMRAEGDLDGSKPLVAGGENDGRGAEDLLNKATLIDCLKTPIDVKLAYSPFRGILFDLWLEWPSHNGTVRRCCFSCLRGTIQLKKSFIRFNLDTDLLKVSIIVQIAKHFTNTWLIS